jgi:hypothetical protein
MNAVAVNTVREGSQRRVADMRSGGDITASQAEAGCITAVAAVAAVIVAVIMVVHTTGMTWEDSGNGAS